MKRNITARERAKTLRSNMTPPERMLWAALRAGRLGVKFKRQYVVDPYIADFAAPSEGLIVEVDGDTHAFAETHDRVRTAFLEERGFRVLRFTNAEVMTNLDGVLRIIIIELGRDPESPSHLPGGEGLGRGG
ncbi:MAG: hypothetical protein C0510_03015 [Erythrobacter sp.]|nr:hypothetical protein [Erythrobacter sp.]